MPFVIRTDALGGSHYWAGIVPGNVGVCHAFTPVIFNAWQFEDRPEAEQVVAEHLGSVWSISEITVGGSLKRMTAKGRA